MNELNDFKLDGPAEPNQLKESILLSSMDMLTAVRFLIRILRKSVYYDFDSTGILKG